MDARQADLLRKIDPAELGQRLRAARVAKGMTQTDLAGADVSVGYVSRIEAGQRRPNLQVLTDLCFRLGTPVEQLLMGVAPQELEQINLNLDFAELSLESGEPQAAELQARDAREAAEAAALKEHTYRARFLVARALEAQGLIDDAVIELEALLTPRVGNVLQIKVGLALVRCYRTSGDFSKSIEVGEMLLEHLAETPLASTDEAVQLAVSMSLAYYFRGDVAQAVRVCRKAMAKAEKLDSPVARASAYWNASIFEAGRGSVRDAVPLAQRALALFAEGQDARNLAVLRTNLGTLQLQLDPPQVDEAKLNLVQALEEMRNNSANPVDIGRNELAQARAHYLSGEFDLAEMMTVRVLESVLTLSPLTAADAKSLEGQVHAARGDVAQAATAYREAVLILTGVGSDRSAAEMWFELAGLLEDVDEFDAARDAYRSAAASSGIQARPRVKSANKLGIELR
jgi:transcriptional regulator with XRE-family HTH domain